MDQLEQYLLQLAPLSDLNTRLPRALIEIRELIADSDRRIGDLEAKLQRLQSEIDNLYALVNYR